MARTPKAKRLRGRSKSLRSRKKAAQAERSYMGGRRSKSRKTHGNPVSKVKMLKRAPKGWIKAKAVRVVRRGGKRIVEVKR